jgi:hypothetical protein
VNERANAGDDQHHHHRQLVDLEGEVDLKIARRHPAEVALHERRMELARAQHRHEDCHREAERRREHERADEARHAGETVPGDWMVIIAVRAGLLGVLHPRFVTGTVPAIPVRIRIRGAGVVRGGQRQQPVDDEADEGEDRQQPGPIRDRAGEGVRACQCGVLEEHHPFRRLMFWRFTDWR